MEFKNEAKVEEIKDEKQFKDIFKIDENELLDLLEAEQMLRPDSLEEIKEEVQEETKKVDSPLIKEH